MSYSDWDLMSGYGSNVESPALGLSNPLSVGGTYCRYFSVQNGGSALACRGYSAGASYDGGSLYNVPNTKAIRVQGYFRMTAISSGISRSGAWLGAKLPEIFYTSIPLDFSSYCLGIKAAGSSTLQLSIMLAGGTADLEAASFDTWYGLRLEVFPIGTSADRVIAYKETVAGSGTWVSIYDATIPSTAGNFIPWGGNRKNGFFFLQEQQLSGAVAGYADVMTVAVGAIP